jgi:hypothetical protein
MKTVQINGLTFEIDTADWKYDKDGDADKCAELMISKLKALPGEVLAKAHADLLLDFELGGDIFNACDIKANPEFWQVQAIGSACKNEIMADWTGVPKIGYNAGIYAVANA